MGKKTQKQCTQGNKCMAQHHTIYQYIPHPLCIYQGVQKLPPGHYAIFKRGELKVENYWQPDLTKTTSFSPIEIQNCIDELLNDSVKLRLQSDVPLGAFLSGGVDSSIMVALMQQHASQRIKTFSVGFPEKQYDESSYARQVAKHLKTDHHELIIEPTIV